MTRTTATHATVTLDLEEGLSFEYKLTRGAWSNVEVQADGSSLPNRSLTAQYGTTGSQAVPVTVARWADRP